MPRSDEQSSRYHLMDPRRVRAMTEATAAAADAEEWRESVTEKLETLQNQVNEIHVVRKLIAWAIPMALTGALSFAITAAVAFYRLDDLSGNFAAHSASPAMVAHPGTAEALWEVKRDVAELKTSVESMQRELGLRDADVRERLTRIQAQLDRLGESSSERSTAPRRTGSR